MGGYCITIVIIMRNIEYKVYCFRLSKETIKKLREQQKKRGESWNLFFKKILKKL